MFSKLTIICLFICIALMVGFFCRTHSQNVTGFILGGRSVGPWLSAFAFGTSYFSAVIFVGYAGQFGWKYGISALWIGIGNALLGSLLAWWVLGPRTRAMTQNLQSNTMPDFFGKRYKSRALKTAAALIIFIFLIPYTASIYNGLSRLFEMAFDLPFEVCIIAMALITCIYVVLGGYMATVVNDFIQGIVMLFGIIAVIAAVVSTHGGLTESLVQLSLVPHETSPLNGCFVSFFGPDPLNLLGVVILTSLGTWGLPQMVQKFYAIKSGPAIKRSAIISTIFALVVAGGSYFLGGFSRLFTDQIPLSASGEPLYDAIIPTMLSGLPDVLVGLVIVLVLSASMSTLSSLVLTSSSTLTLDLIKDRFTPNMSEKGQLVCMRGLIVMFVIISAVIALLQYRNSLTFIAQLMGISWGALAGSFLGPFLWGLYSKKISTTAIWTSFAVGVGFTSLNMILGLFGTPLIASPVNAGAIAIVMSLVCVPLVSAVTKPVPFDLEKALR